MRTNPVHLLSEDLLDACGTAVSGSLELAPFTTPERITCPLCRPLIAQELKRTKDTDHAEALEEDAMHDAAVSAAQDLTPELLERISAPGPMPRALRTRLQMERRLSLVPPGARK